jgi:hypothetical protein
MLPCLVTRSRTGREKISLIAMFAAFVSKVLSSSRAGARCFWLGRCWRQPNCLGLLGAPGAPGARAPFLVEAWPPCSRIQTAFPTFRSRATLHTETASGPQPCLRRGCPWCRSELTTLASDAHLRTRRRNSQGFVSLVTSGLERQSLASTNPPVCSRRSLGMPGQSAAPSSCGSHSTSLSACNTVCLGASLQKLGKLAFDCFV